MEYITIIIIALSVSMDAFSLSLFYGTKGLVKKQKYQLSLIVGIFHFIMPLLGIMVSNQIIVLLSLPLHFLITPIFILIGIEMIASSFEKKEEIKLLKTLQLYLFGLSVSIDSFSVGMVLVDFTNKYILTAIIFLIFSFLFTLLGLTIGNKTNEQVGSISTLIGGLILIIIGIVHFLI